MCVLDIVLTRNLNILTTNKLVKLTMFWTTAQMILRGLDVLSSCSVICYKGDNFCDFLFASSSALKGKNLLPLVIDRFQIDQKLQIAVFVRFFTHCLPLDQ